MMLEREERIEEAQQELGRRIQEIEKQHRDIEVSVS